jgi:hypothetical protein
MVAVNGKPDIGDQINKKKIFIHLGHLGPYSGTSFACIE